MARDEPSDDEPSETHALFLPENPIQLPKDGILPVVREGTMGGTPARREDESK